MTTNLEKMSTQPHHCDKNSFSHALLFLTPTLLATYTHSLSICFSIYTFTNPPVSSHDLLKRCLSPALTSSLPAKTRPSTLDTPVKSVASFSWSTSTRSTKSMSNHGSRMDHPLDEVIHTSFTALVIAAV